MAGDEQQAVLRAMLIRLHGDLTEVLKQLPDDPTTHEETTHAKPVTRGGARRIIAKYLAERGEGHVFTIRELEKVVATQTGKNRTEVDRRLREMREVRWVIGSCKTDPTLLPDQMRVVHVGDMIWHPQYRWPAGRSCPAWLRRAILERDNHTCQVQSCGIKAGEAYPGEPDSRARLTIGRALPGARGGQYSLENCRAECSRCNEEIQTRYDYGDGAAT